MCVLNNLRRKVLYDDSIKFKVEAKAQNGKIKREYTIEASNGKELSEEIRRIEREWVLETGILYLTITL